ncbi:unnamed protein product [Clonostachys rosea f. rosea IK726]|uniref:Uncharacterized protein n=2 Tax=Bionectria ochroleuca TaxID=29856 RepID=A0A0B7K7E2_BIOOC|nr:unnamed protein product [Clonostachys rosea f. rosea IK726]
MTCKRPCHALLVDIYDEKKYKKQVVSDKFRILISRTQRDSICKLRGKHSKLPLNCFHIEYSLV